jgi:uncharacterized RmlC-like cupin family protein
MRRSQYVLREEDVPAYHPANHVGTVNRRVISAETVGATRVEVLVGTLERGPGALPHAHPGIEQTGYLLAGRARVTIGEGAAAETVECGPGDWIFFPADTMHRFEVISEEPVRVVVIYTPPYGEDPAKVIRPGATATRTTA